MESVNSVAEFVSFVNSNRDPRQEHSSVRWWFRGQVNAGWPLMPGIYRSDRSEDDRLNIERHIMRDFRALSAGLIRGRSSDAELYFLQQHYGIPTRLLDWTPNALTALFFSVAEADRRDNEEADAIVYMLDVYNLWRVQNATRAEYEGIASSRRPVFREMLKPIMWEEPTRRPYVLALRPDQKDVRLRLQRGCFTMHPPERKILTIRDASVLRRCHVPSARKKEVREQLIGLGIDHFNTFGDLSALAKTLKTIYAAPRSTS